MAWEEKLTNIDCLFRDYLNGEIDWPQYGPQGMLAVRRQLDITRQALAELLRVPATTVARWEKGAEDIPPMVDIALCVLSKLGPQVFLLMDKDIAGFELKAAGTRGGPLTQGLDDPVYNHTLRELQERLPEPFDKEALVALRKRLGMNRTQFAKRLGVSLKTAVNWETGATDLKGPTLELMKILWRQGLDALDDGPDGGR